MHFALPPFLGHMPSFWLKWEKLRDYLGRSSFGRLRNGRSPFRDDSRPENFTTCQTLHFVRRLNAARHRAKLQYRKLEGTSSSCSSAAARNNNGLRACLLANAPSRPAARRANRADSCAVCQRAECQSKKDCECDDIMLLSSEGPRANWLSFFSRASYERSYQKTRKGRAVWVRRTRKALSRKREMLSN